MTLTLKKKINARGTPLNTRKIRKTKEKEQSKENKTGKKQQKNKEQADEKVETAIYAVSHQPSSTVQALG